MKKKRFTEEQIIGILREQEAGAKGRRSGAQIAVSEATLYNWKAKFGGMDAGGALRSRRHRRRKTMRTKRSGQSSKPRP